MAKFKINPITGRLDMYSKPSRVSSSETVQVSPIAAYHVVIPLKNEYVNPVLTSFQLYRENDDGIDTYIEDILWKNRQLTSTQLIFDIEDTESLDGVILAYKVEEKSI
ncbi:hypothetical protein ACRTDU_03855 [Sunxiuqinia elliptica]